jgi:glycosyltransferase involved in cell wall biosynthesis
MKIALFTDGIYPYVIGGMQKHSYYLAKYFASEGIQVDLYHFNASDKDIYALELFSDAEKKNIRSIVLDFPVAGQLPGHYLRESFAYSNALYTAFLKNGPVDYIYAKGFTAWRLLDAKRKGQKFPHVGVNFHGYEMFQPAVSIRSRLEQYLLRGPVRFNIRWADQVFSYGGKISDLIQSLGIPPAKIIALPTGIEKNWLQPIPSANHTPRRFIFVGRYERRKGIEELNRVLTNWDQVNFEFVFIGDVPEATRIKKAGISYLGAVTDPEQMQQLLREADVLVCPSHSEGMPNVVMEAMASGLAIIATDVGAMEAMVNSDNGWLIAPQSESALLQAMQDALNIADLGLTNKKIKSLEKVKSRFLWDVLIKETLQQIRVRI